MRVDRRVALHAAADLTSISAQAATVDVELYRQCQSIRIIPTKADEYPIETLRGLREFVLVVARWYPYGVSTKLG